jgi:hypothetical protein
LSGGFLSIKFNQFFYKSPEDGGHKLLQNDGNKLPIDTSSYARKLKFPSKILQKPEITQHGKFYQEPEAAQPINISVFM